MSLLISNMFNMMRRRKMLKLKYAILFTLSMILFSIPVLAAQTYYLPSKIECKEEPYYKKYSYDKHGHLISAKENGEETDGELEEEYYFEYDKNGKRISGSYTEPLGTDYILSFDKKQYLDYTDHRYDYEGGRTNYEWNKKGYLVKGYNSEKYTYYFSKDGKLSKSAKYQKNKKQDLSYYNKNGLLTKNISYADNTTTKYEYKYNKNGLVTTIIKNITNNKTKKKTVKKYIVTYSKIKTDKKTYTLFINGNDSCLNNALL